MSTKCLSWAIEQRTGSATRKLILLLLADLADEQMTCYPGREYLAERAELSPGAVSKAITALAADGFVRVLRRAKNRGGRRSNRYLLCLFGDDTPLPDVDDWVSEFLADVFPADDETAGHGNGVAGALLPDDGDETAGHDNGVAATPLPDPSNGVAATHSNVSDEHVSKSKEFDPSPDTKDQIPPPPPYVAHPVRATSSAAAAEPPEFETARAVLRRVCAGVADIRLPTEAERGRLVARVAALFAEGWRADALGDRLLGMGSLTTVASVYAVLTSRLGNVGDPLPGDDQSTSSPVPALPWCRGIDCDKTTRRLLDAEDRPRFEVVAGQRRALWCPTCSGR